MTWKVGRVTKEEVLDDAALVAFCEREHPRLVGALSLYTGSPSVAEELAHEALIRVMDDWPRVRAMVAPGAWAHRVAMNLANSWFRRRAAERRALARIAAATAHSVTSDVAAAVAVRNAVAELPDRQRRCLLMRHYLGFPLDITAATLGITEQAASSLCYRAMQTLRSQLRDDTPLQEIPDVR
jgi:RNA polymerase sigma factor (sigma-70 family)